MRNRPLIPTMPVTILLFWISLGLLAYTYAGYGSLVYLLRLFGVRQRRPARLTDPDHPEITLIVAAYNEAPVLEQKIRNSRELDYPPGKLRFLFITDGSDDGSEHMFSAYPDILHLHDPVRNGKYAALKRAMRCVETPVAVFTDADTLLNPGALRRLAVHFQDPRVGGVAGEKKVLHSSGRRSAMGTGEGLYWRYESFHKRMDAVLGTVIGASGELFAIRSDLFRERSVPVLLDDLVITMDIRLQGYRIRYEADAYATERPSASLREERKRKVRIAAGSWQSIGLLRQALNPFRYPLLFFQYLSRRLLRWIFCPPALLLLFLANAWIFWKGASSAVYPVFFVLQCLFYFLALLGWYRAADGKRGGWLTVPFYFVFMHYCQVRGLYRYLRGGQSVRWERSLREQPL
ncbi:MAG: hypothetical protein RJA57_341 [Bacteroidota bacterium]